MPKCDFNIVAKQLYWNHTSAWVCKICCIFSEDIFLRTPANICWSWRRLQNVLSVTIFRLPRRFEDVLQMRLKDVLEDEKLLRWSRLEDVLKTCLEDVLKTSWWQTKCLLGISLSNKSKSVSDKPTSHISISAKSRRIQNALIRTH